MGVRRACLLPLFQFREPCKHGLSVSPCGGRFKYRVDPFFADIAVIGFLDRPNDFVRIAFAFADLLIDIRIIAGFV